MPKLDEYVAECRRALWDRGEAEPIRRWLMEARRLPADVLEVNRIGADLGPARQARPEGVPGVRAAVTLPVLVDGGACYVQLRTLMAGRVPKYLNPRDDLAVNPRVGFYQPARTYDFPTGDRDEVVVTEGAIDALSAAAGGYRAAAVLGASYGDAAAARVLSRVEAALVVAFDPDPAGRSGAERLVRLLNAEGRPPGVMVLRAGDLNENLVRAADWPVELAGRVEHAMAHPGRMPSHSVAPSIA